MIPDSSWNRIQRDDPWGPPPPIWATDDPWRWTITTASSDTTATTTIDYTIGSSWSTNIIEFREPAPDRKQLARERCWEKLTKARVALRSKRPSQPRQHQRPVSRGRVCSGASRYRVMV